MHTIWKFPIPQATAFTLELPRRARFLDVQVQEVWQDGRKEEQPQAWFLLDPESKKIERRFVVVGTGHPVSEQEMLTHLGTFQLFGGTLVMHLFEYDALVPVK